MHRNVYPVALHNTIIPLKLELSVHIEPITRYMLQINLSLIPDFQYDIKVHDYDIISRRSIFVHHFMVRSLRALASLSSRSPAYPEIKVSKCQSVKVSS